MSASRSKHGTAQSSLSPEAAAELQTEPIISGLAPSDVATLVPLPLHYIAGSLNHYNQPRNVCLPAHRLSVQRKWSCQWYHKQAMGSPVPPQPDHVPQRRLEGAFQSSTFASPMSTDHNQVQGIHATRQAYKHNMGTCSGTL